MTFQLHPQLEQDSIELGHFSLSKLLLINDSQYPWFVLVPQRCDMTEIYQLSVDDQRLLTQESSLLAETLAHSFNADKMNIASIGNIVHIHHRANSSHIAWPLLYGVNLQYPYLYIANGQLLFGVNFL